MKRPTETGLPVPATSEQPRSDEAFGLAFERENGHTDIARWRQASEHERSQAIAELITHAEQVAAVTGIRNDEPAPRLPRRWAKAGDGS